MDVVSSLRLSTVTTTFFWFNVAHEAPSGVCLCGGVFFFALLPSHDIEPRIIQDTSDPYDFSDGGEEGRMEIKSYDRTSYSKVVFKKGMRANV